MDKFEQVKKLASGFAEEVRKPRDYDDKHLVIICITLITLVYILAVPNSAQVVRDAMLGMFGIAVGKGMKG